MGSRKGKRGEQEPSPAGIDVLEMPLNLVPVGVLSVENGCGDRIRVNRHAAGLLREEGSSLSGSLRLYQSDRELSPDEQPLQRAARSGQPVRNFEGHIVRADGSRIDVMMSATPLFDEAGKVRGGIAVILDASERRAAEARQQLLLHELQHRVKNIITTIGALATRMVKRSASLEEFSQAFLGRLRAMAVAHELLSSSNWTGTALRVLIESALQSHIGKNNAAVGLSGPELMLTANAAMTLGLVLYELATNASKYGSLSMADGRIDVTWRTTTAADGERVILEWVERDGPRVTRPMGEGFGTSFVKRSVEYELDGTVDLQLLPEGLRCTISFPPQSNVQQEMASG